MKDFKGKTAFVTGGAEGIGYFIGQYVRYNFAAMPIEMDIVVENGVVFWEH